MSLVKRILNPSVILLLLILSIGGWVYYGWSYFPDFEYKSTLPKALQGDE